MNPSYPNAPLLHSFEKPYGGPHCDAARDEIQDLLRCLERFQSKYVITNNRKNEFCRLLHQVVQTANKQLRLLGIDVPEKNNDNSTSHSNAFSSVSDELRWYRPVVSGGRRTAQYMPTVPKNQPQESDVMGNGLSNLFNEVGAWTNQNILQNPTNNYDMVWRRTVGLAQDIAANAVEIPTMLRQQITRQLEQSASLIAPYTSEQGAQPRATSSGTRSASVRDLSGLSRMVADLQALTMQALGNLNPPLVAQFAAAMGGCQTLLQEYQQGGTSGSPQVGTTSPFTAPMFQQQAKGPSVNAPDAVSQWAQANGTTPAAFLQRVRGWMSENAADASALSFHLQQYSVPRGVTAWAVGQL